MQPCHQDGINGIPLQQHRRQAQGQCAPPGKALQRGAGVQDAAIDPLRLRHKGPACFGQRHAGGAALKQGQIKLLFQTADLVAEGGLGAVVKFKVRLTVRKHSSWWSFIRKKLLSVQGKIRLLSV